jgi:hypothetical protein
MDHHDARPLRQSGDRRELVSVRLLVVALIALAEVTAASV